MSKLNLLLTNLSILIVTISSFLQPILAKETQIPQQTLSWWSIFRRKPPREGTTKGSRPSEQLCFISPQISSQTKTIWNAKPFFLWKGNIKKIAVGIPRSKEYLKTQIVTGSQSVNYTGKPLEPGKIYRWSIFLSESENASSTRLVPFKIMEAPQRNRITAELKLLERLQKNQGADAEKIAFTKTKYFADKGLWSDALQQAYSVPNPSPELSQMKEELPNQLCK
ncbi:hypothetical protein NIES267_10710 [Calothrix parasitica NIES-267]|uniref:DUF928 domain-containing protein n=1 Tax=Calothrix parasitica NIES-267 TaxID=1973488 RepID=A0A1Z4LK72_9CYAN|nr:hypothetical protein NIES267_10710 [Calothrix parasitica NIES-267]